MLGTGIMWLGNWLTGRCRGLVVGPTMWGPMEGVGVLDMDGVGDWWMAM